MLRQFTFASILALSISPALAQVTGPIPNTSLEVGRDFNWGGWATTYESSRQPTTRDIEIERRYRETVSAKIPDRKASKDPWRNLRQAAPATVPDRHRVE
jgi:hypothetical protein